MSMPYAFDPIHVLPVMELLLPFTAMHDTDPPIPVIFTLLPSTATLLSVTSIPPPVSLFPVTEAPGAGPLMYMSVPFRRLPVMTRSWNTAVTVPALSVLDQVEPTSMKVVVLTPLTTLEICQ